MFVHEMPGDYSDHPIDLRRSAHRQLLFWGIIVLVLLASLPLHLESPTADVSWLITMCERMLAGEVAYVDLLEITPPIPMLLYMPPVVVGQILDVSPETTLVALVYIIGALIIVLTFCTLPRKSTEQIRAAYAIILSAALTLYVFPAEAFAQREYFAALFALPMVAVFIGHAQCGVWPPISLRVIATVLAALTVAIKPPFFALPGVLIFCYYLWRTRGFAFVMASGLFVAGLLSVLITVATFAWFSDYFGLVWTLIQDVYLQAKSHPLNFIIKYEANAVLLALGATILLQIKQRHSSAVWLLLLAGVGFLVAYFIQGKYFNYHAYPPALLIFCALSLAIVERISSLELASRAFKTVFSLIYAAILIASPCLMYAGMRNNNPRMSDLSWTAHLENPTVAAISPIISTSFPFVREFGGVWVDQTHSQWVAFFTHVMLARGGLSPEVRQAMIRHHKDDLVRLLESIERNSPDILLVNISSRDSWLIAQLKGIKPSFLDDYLVVGEEGILRIMARRDLSVARQPLK